MSNLLVKFKRFSLDALGFTAIAAPITCSYVVLLNEDGTNSITLRSDEADASTEKTLAPGVQEYFGGSQHAFRFDDGQVVVYAKAAAGTATLHASFMF